MCDVPIRVDSAAPQRGARSVSWITLGSAHGHEVLLDSRLVDRMPTRLRLVQRGVGPFRHLDLDLSGEQSADVLYAVAR